MSQKGENRAFDVRIGVICDVFFYESVCSVADFVYIPPSNASWDSVKGIDVLLVASTWQGMVNGEWHGFAKPGTEQRAIAMKLISECKANGVKTVFYSKDDPADFECFKDFALACDYVFTSCEEIIPEYRKLCGHDRVWTMPFCVSSPLRCGNCGDESSGAHKVVFAGSWMRRYPIRCSQLRMLFDGALSTGVELSIYDRNSWRGKSRYLYPKKYRGFVHPAVEHKYLQKIHKAAQWAINVNTVTSSATMFAVRVYELLAEGVNVVSNYSYGMCRQFPSVSIAYSPQIAADIINRTQDGVRALQRIVGRRDVIAGFSAQMVLGEMLGRIGLPQCIDNKFLADYDMPALPPSSEPLYGDCRVKISKKRNLRIVISVGSNWRGLVLKTMPSLLRCKRFGNFEIELVGLSPDDSATRDLAERLVRDFANIHIAEGAAELSERAITLNAGDEVFATAFDRFAAKAKGIFQSAVAAPVLLCGRCVRFRKDGVRIGANNAWRVRRVLAPVLCRYGDFGEESGAVYSAKPPKGAFRRALKCYRDNGLAKTLRRVFLGECVRGKAIGSK